MYDSVLIRKNRSQRKPIFWRILPSDKDDRLQMSYKTVPLQKKENEYSEDQKISVLEFIFSRS